MSTKRQKNLLDKIKVITRGITKVINSLERDIFLAGYYKAFALGAGHCQLCPECTLKIAGIQRSLGHQWKAAE
jgi:predicted metal-binding protein